MLYIHTRTYLQEVEGVLHVVVLAQIERQDIGRGVRVQQPVEGAMPRVETHL